MNNTDIDFKISSVFRKRLRRLVKDSLYEESELPKLIGIGKDLMIRALSVGMIPSVKSLIKIADFFEVFIGYLLGYTDSDTFVQASPPVTFRQRLVELKREKKVSFCKIATELGFSRSLFNSWEKNNYIPSLEIVYLLSDYFKVSVDYLLGRTDERS